MVDPTPFTPKKPKLALISETALASLFAHEAVADWRYVFDWGQWMYWDGHQWDRDDVLAIEDAVQLFVGEHGERAASDKAKTQLTSSRMVFAILKLARSSKLLRADVGQWDHDAMALSCKGTIHDLGSSVSRAAVAGDYVTKTCAVEPGADGCPKWEAFLRLITGGDEDLMHYLQVMSGYLLTGSTKEQCLFFLYGPGGNGKSTFVNTIAGVMGDYAVNAPMDMLAISYHERHPTELARLQGARLVTASETAEGRRWDETRLKQLTGGDMISARYMNQNFFDFMPQFKLLASGNHKPELRGIDEALRRRVRIIPFVVRIAESERIFGFEELLKEEWSGILTWMMDGCAMWLEEGLGTVPAVTEATSDYFEAEDTVALWLQEATADAPDNFETSTSLFQSWEAYCKRTGEKAPGSMKALISALKKRTDLRWHRSSHSRGFYGKRIMSFEEQDLWSHRP